MTMKPLQIEHVYVFMMPDEFGNESIPAALGHDGAMYPLIGADWDRVQSMIPIAAQIQKESGRKVTLLEFSERSELKWSTGLVGPSPSELAKRPSPSMLPGMPEKIEQKEMLNVQEPRT